MAIGDIFRMTSWTHVELTARFSFKCFDKKQVAVFMLLGYEAKDGNTLLDLEAALNHMGWIRDPEISFPQKAESSSSTV